MDKLLADQISRVNVDAYPQAMGIKIMSLAQTEPMYIEGFGVIFTYRIGIPLARGSGAGTSQPTTAAQSSAWERARRDLATRRRWSTGDVLTVAPKPRSLDYRQAASVPLSALTAWQAFFDHAKLSAGQTVLIHGAAGGVGVMAVQLARWVGAYVIATASASNRRATKVKT